MANIQRLPFVRHIRADITNHIQQFRKGKRIRSGRGLSFWFMPAGTSISEIPMDDRALHVMLRGQSQDYQDIAVQGTIVWRALDAERLGERIDFAVNLQTGELIGSPIDQINDQLNSMGRRFLDTYVKHNTVRHILEAGIDPIQTILNERFKAEPSLTEMGLQIIGVSVDDVTPSSELARALQVPTFEALQQQADEATFSRRALAVENERAIAENELKTKIELETQRKQLIAREDENARSKAEAKAAAMKIATDSEADRIRVIDQAKADMEKERLSVYQSLPPVTMFAMATQEFAGKLQTIDSITVTPDMISNLIGQVQNITRSAQQPGEQ